MVKSVIEFLINHFLIITVWVILFVALMYLIILGWLSGYSEVSCYKAIRLINMEQSIIIDVRDQNNFYQSHIINSIHLSAENIRKGGCARELIKFKEIPLILVCGNGVVSCTVARYLCKLGFKRVYVLKGGIVTWNNESLPLVK